MARGSLQHTTPDIPSEAGRQLLDLANEVLSLVIEECQPHYFDCLVTQEVKNLRLTCKRLAEVADPILFRKISLPKATQYVKLVKCLRIQPQRYSYVRELSIQIATCATLSHRGLPDRGRLFGRLGNLASLTLYDCNDDEVSAIPSQRQNATSSGSRN
jgi:hypothetical protein